MRLIDADALLPMMKYATTDSEIGVFPIKIGFNAIAKVIDDAPTVDAVPNEALRLFVNWAEECDFGYDNIPEEYERYKDRLEDMGYIDGLMHIAIWEAERMDAEREEE